jgi:hypothetical protein
MKYFYLVFQTPVGHSSQFYRGELHPMSKAVLEPIQTDLASKLSLMTGNSFTKDHILPISIMKLSMDVVQDRWPEDFTNKTLLGAINESILEVDPLDLYKTSQQKDEYSACVAEIHRNIQKYSKVFKDTSNWSKTYRLDCIFSIIYASFLLEWNSHDLPDTRFFWDIAVKIKEKYPVLFD